MRHTLLLLLLVTGCEDFGKLQKDFCQTAKVSHTIVPSDANLDMLEAKYPFDLGFPSHNVPVVLCDDFEEPSIDTSKWEMMNILLGGTIETEHYAKVDRSGHGVDGNPNDPAYAYRGRGALHAVAPMNGAAQLVETQVTPNLGTPAIRAFVWPGTGQIVGTTQLFALVDADGNDIRRVSLVNGVPMITDLASGMSLMADGQLSQRQWNCINFFSRDTRMDVIVGNGVGATLSGLPSQAQAAASRIGPARGNDSNPNPSEMWIDEVILDSTLVGCTQ